MAFSDLHYGLRYKRHILVHYSCISRLLEALT